MEERVNRIMDFLRERPLLSVSGIEKEVGLPNATIKKVSTKWMAYPRKHEDKIEKIEILLEKYGYEKDGVEL